MERAGRPELLKTIDAQKDQLQTYKNKLRDVVAAYKSVVIEKEALEASVAVLSSCGDSGGVPAVPDSNGDEGDGGNQASTADPLGVEAGEEEAKDELPSLKNQIKTLSMSLMTITQEKNKIEANFIADKKQVMQEIEDLQQSLAKERNRTSTQAEGFELQITDLKSRLRTQQLEREKDQTNHGLMLKELQTLVAKERMDKEQLTTQLEDAKRRCKEKEEKLKSTPTISESYERQIDELKRELMSVRDQMKAAELKANQPSPFVLELQQEMTRVKETHQRQLTQEQMKASESEIKIQSQANQSEERVSSLEEKLSELSRVVGNYERLKFQDQQAMSKLRERVTQLDLENTALVHAAKLTYGTSESMEDNLSADEILNKIMHFRELLISASESESEMSDTPIKMSSIFVKDLNKSDEESSVCKQYKNQLEKVKEEFERYKLRAQSVLKTKNKDNSSVAELDSLKEQNSDLRNKLRMSNSHHNEEIVQFQIKVDNLSKALLAQEEKGKLEISQIKSFHQKEISQLQLEVKKQRDRSLALLSEKDQQIQRMTDWRDVHSSGSGGAGVDSFHADILERGGNSEELSKQSEEVQAIHKLLNLPKEVENEAFIHFAQEKARADVDVSTLRKQKRELEMALRESYAEAKQTERQLKDEISVFKNHSAEVERQSYREGANLEYLKNVLLKFFTSTDWEGKKRMVKALMTILQFSPQESQQVQQVYNKGWWGSS